MRIVTMEEHFSIPELQKRISGEVIEARGFFSKDKPYGPAGPGDKMQNLEKGRIEAMDAAGVTVQVLSHEGPGSDLLPATESPAWAKEANDILAAHVKKHPTRYAGFAHLPLTAPKAAAEELERCIKKLGFAGALVNGSTSGKFLDAPEYDDVLTVAEKLGVPIYLHPNIPVKAVRESYYEGGLPKEFSYLFGIAGFGWHVDTAVHILRLVLSGALDRHPNLKLITGHMGEMLPGMLARFDQMFENCLRQTPQAPHQRADHPAGLGLHQRLHHRAAPAHAARNLRRRPRHALSRLSRSCPWNPPPSSSKRCPSPPPTARR